MFNRILASYKNNLLKWNLIILIVGFILSVGPFVYFNQMNISKFVEDNSTFAGFIGLSIAVLTLVFTGYQSIMSRRQHIKGLELNKRNKAIELAKDYKKLLDEDISYVVAGMENIGVADRMDKYNHSDLKHFDKNELVRVIHKEDREYIKNAIDKLDAQKLISVYCHHNKQYTSIIESKKKRFLAAEKELGPKIKLIDEKVKKSRGSLSKEELQDLKSELNQFNDLRKLKYEAMEEDLMVSSEFFLKIESAMNNLEWFSMHFKNAVADEDVVYQSLHQSFLNTVRLLYTQIAEMNDLPYEKYFINMIWLYNHWKGKMEVKMKEHTDFNQKQVTDKKSFKP